MLTLVLIGFVGTLTATLSPGLSAYSFTFG